MSKNKQEINMMNMERSRWVPFHYITESHDNDSVSIIKNTNSSKCNSASEETTKLLYRLTSVKNPQQMKT